MDDALFWKYISSSVNELYKNDNELLQALDEIGDHYIHAESIEKILSKKPNNETSKFTNTLKAKINDLFLPHICELFILHQYKNLENSNYYGFEEWKFLEFRAMAIAEGEEVYMALKSMKQEEDLFNKNINPTYFYRQNFINIGSNVIPKMRDDLIILPESSTKQRELLKEIDWQQFSK